MVRAPGVVEHQPVGELPVEEAEVGEEPALGVADEGFREGAMEAFGMGIHLRAFGVSPVVRQTLTLEGLIEDSLELGAVIRQELDFAGGILRKPRHQGLRHADGVAGVFTGKGHGKGDRRDVIEDDEHVAPDAAECRALHTGAFPCPGSGRGVSSAGSR